MINKSTKKQNYFAGIFVILGVLLIAVAWIWFSLNNHKSYKKYETIFFPKKSPQKGDFFIQVCFLKKVRKLSYCYQFFL